MDGEVWKDIEGYDGDYQVSNMGRVRSFKSGREKILKPSVDRGGYLSVSLSKNNKKKFSILHRLVALAFIPNPENKREVNHINGDKFNNRAENLEWVTPCENVQHALKTGLQVRYKGTECYQAKLTAEQILYIRENPDKLSNRALARKFGLTHGTIGKIQFGKTYRNVGGTIRAKHKVNRPRVPDEIREEIRRRYQKRKRGHGSSVLAKEFGLDASTIINIIHEGGD